MLHCRQKINKKLHRRSQIKATQVSHPWALALPGPGSPWAVAEASRALADQPIGRESLCLHLFASPGAFFVFCFVQCTIVVCLFCSCLLFARYQMTWRALSQARQAQSQADQAQKENAKKTVGKRTKNVSRKRGKNVAENVKKTEQKENVKKTLTGFFFTLRT